MRWRTKGLRLQGLLGQLQFGSRVGLAMVGVLLWRQWQWQFCLAARGGGGSSAARKKVRGRQDGGAAPGPCPSSSLGGSRDTQQQRPRVCLPDQTERVERQGAGGTWSCLGASGATGGCAALCVYAGNRLRDDEMGAWWRAGAGRQQRQTGCQMLVWAGHRPKGTWRKLGQVSQWRLMLARCCSLWNIPRVDGDHAVNRR